MLYANLMIQERARPRTKILTELQLIDLVFEKLRQELTRYENLYVHTSFRTEYLSLEGVKNYIIMLSELNHLAIHRSMNRTIFRHLGQSTLETEKNHPQPIYKHHAAQLSMFDINFLKREKIYTKLKYSRSPAYDIVSGGVAALFAGFIGFLVSEKFGIELVDSGDFYTLFMYVVFLAFSTRPLLKLVNQGGLSRRIWSASFIKYYIDSFLRFPLFGYIKPTTQYFLGQRRFYTLI